MPSWLEGGDSDQRVAKPGSRVVGALLGLLLATILVCVTGTAAGQTSMPAGPIVPSLALDRSPRVSSVPTRAFGGTSAVRHPKLQRIVRGLVAAGAPGALAVVRTPTRVRGAAAGLAAIEPRLRLSPGDRYRIASVTKTFVATRVLQLVAQRRLKLTDSIERWLPGLVPNGAAITIRRLLNHTSGLYDYTHDQDWADAVLAQPGREWSPRELLAVATSHQPRFAPGTSWSYSNTNYVVLGLLLETVTGVPLATDLQDRLFRPLGLASTSVATGTMISGRVAHGYIGRATMPDLRGRLLDITSILSPSVGWATAQIVSNAPDVTRFLTALLRGRLLPSALLKAMKTEVMYADYGLGLRINRTSCGTAFGHDGDLAGWRNIVWATANGRRAAAVMVNIDNTRVPWRRLRVAAESALCSG
jgi:D-alanyl-D-alanine carboxypeptidase